VGEGAAFIVLESLEHAGRRNAPVLAEMVGYGNSCDAYHPLLQPPDGEKAIGAIHQAMNDAQLKPESIDYINAHGSGTPMNDKTETVIIKKVFGDRAYKIPISSTKSMIGHAMGACGALELAACVLMLEEQYLHPTINLHQPDSDCDLDYIPNVGRYQNIDTLLKLSFGFGGYNAACILRKFN
jgi:3-oxoacyl-[acyl-carrier-protein] synthase II